MHPPPPSALGVASSVLAAGLLFLALALPELARATETLTARGQLDESAVTAQFRQANLQVGAPSANTLTLTFPREGGAAQGEFRIEYANFPLGQFLYALGSGLGSALGEAVGGAISGGAQAGGAAAGGLAGAGGAAAQPTRPPAATSTPTQAQRDLMRCTSTLYYSGTVTGTYDGASRRFSGQAQVAGSFLKDVRCPTTVRGVNDGSLRDQPAVQSMALAGTFDGSATVTGQFVAQGEPPLTFRASTSAAATATATRPTAAPAAAVQPTPRTTAPSTGALPEPALAPGSVRDPDMVSDEGLPRATFQPGTKRPTPAQTAGAAGIATAGAGAMATLAAIRAGRREREGGGRGGGGAGLVDGPGGGLPGNVLRERIQTLKEREARKVLEKAKIPKEVVAGLDDPVGALTHIAGSIGNPRELGRAVRHTLATNPRATEALLNRNGISTPMIAALGGPERVVRIAERLVRNPPRAIGEFFKDAGRNIARPGRLVRHTMNAVGRVIDNTPAGPVVRLLRGLFRRPPRPQAIALGAGMAPPPSAPPAAFDSPDTTTPRTLSSTPPEPMEDPYAGIPDTGEGGAPR